MSAGQNNKIETSDFNTDDQNNKDWQEVKIEDATYTDRREVRSESSLKGYHYIA